MGFEDEAEERKRQFAAYQVNSELMRLARPDALFMHCLPAHRGEEVDAASSTARRASCGTRLKTGCIHRRR
jgi:ornithine carbamoyltransferase